MFFDTWDGVLHAVVRAAAACTVIVVAVRVIGERVLAKLTAYELIAAIVVGAIVASIPLSETPLAETLAALAVVLLVLGAARSSRALRRPRLVVWQGELVRSRLGRWGVGEAEVRAAIRRAGIASIAEVQAAVLEADGEWSVVRRVDCGHDRSALDDVAPPT